MESKRKNKKKSFDWGSWSTYSLEERNLTPCIQNVAPVVGLPFFFRSWNTWPLESPQMEAIPGLQPRSRPPRSARSSVTGGSATRGDDEGVPPLSQRRLKDSHPLPTRRNPSHPCWPLPILPAVAVGTGRPGRDARGLQAEGRAGRPGCEAGGWGRLQPPGSRLLPLSRRAGGRRRVASREAAWGRRRRCRAGPEAAERVGASARVPRASAALAPRPLPPGAARALGSARHPPAAAAGTRVREGRGRPRWAPGTTSPLREARTAGPPRGAAETKDPGRRIPRTPAARGNHQGPGGPRPDTGPRRLEMRTPEAARTVRASFSRFEGVPKPPLVLFNRPFPTVLNKFI